MTCIRNLGVSRPPAYPPLEFYALVPSVIVTPLPFLLQAGDHLFEPLGLFHTNAFSDVLRLGIEIFFPKRGPEAALPLLLTGAFLICIVRVLLGCLRVSEEYRSILWSYA